MLSYCIRRLRLASDFAELSPSPLKTYVARACTRCCARVRWCSRCSWPQSPLFSTDASYSVISQPRPRSGASRPKQPRSPALRQHPRQHRPDPPTSCAGRRFYVPCFRGTLHAAAWKGAPSRPVLRTAFGGGVDSKHKLVHSRPSRRNLFPRKEKFPAAKRVALIESFFQSLPSSLTASSADRGRSACGVPVACHQNRITPLLLPIRLRHAGRRIVHETRFAEDPFRHPKEA